MANSSLQTRDTSQTLMNIDAEEQMVALSAQVTDSNELSNDRIPVKKSV